MLFCLPYLVYFLLYALSNLIILQWTKIIIFTFIHIPSNAVLHVVMSFILFSSNAKSAIWKSAKLPRIPIDFPEMQLTPISPTAYR